MRVNWGENLIRAFRCIFILSAVSLRARPCNFSIFKAFFTFFRDFGRIKGVKRALSFIFFVQFCSCPAHERIFLRFFRFFLAVWLPCYFFCIFFTYLSFDSLVCCYCFRQNPLGTENIDFQLFFRAFFMIFRFFFMVFSCFFSFCRIASVDSMLVFSHTFVESPETEFLLNQRFRVSVFSHGFFVLFAVSPR